MAMKVTLLYCIDNTHTNMSTSQKILFDVF